AGRPYTLCTVNWFVDDPAIDSLVQGSWDATLLVPGIRFDADVLDRERSRITEMLRRNGYLFFNRDLLQYVADTSAGDHEVDVALRMERPLAQGRRGLAGTAEGRVYFLEDITVNMAARSVHSATLPAPDPVEYTDNRFLFSGKRPAYRPKALSSSILLRSGAKFNEVTNDRTWRRLTNLRVFDRVEITYDTTDTRMRAMADVRIELVPSKRQSLSLEGFGTNRGGFL